MSEPQLHYRTCPLCEATCGLELTVIDDRVTRIRGDRDDVFSKGFICPKGSVLQRVHEDPDRLRKPMIRRGSPDDRDSWEEVSWDEAFAAIREGLAPLLAGNRDQVAVFLGNPGVHNHATAIGSGLMLHALGTKNLYTASTLDQMPRHVSGGLMFGSPGAISVPDLDRTDYLLILGGNPYVSNGSLCTAPDFPARLQSLKERGGQLVVVDPIRTRTAEEATEHIAIRPGTDAHLMVALMHEIFATDMVGAERLSCLNGFEGLADLVEPFSADAVAPLCGIPAQQIRRIAAELAAAPSAAIYGRMGAHTVPFGTIAAWAADALAAITGNLDRPGGNMFARAPHARPDPATPGGRGWTTGRWKSRVAASPEIKNEYPIAILPEEITTPGEGQVRAFITVAGNPARSGPNSKRFEAALTQLDFMVSVDPALNETTRFANVILPPPSPLERSHYDAAFYGLSVRNVANFSPALFEPTGMTEEEILTNLALIMSGLEMDAQDYLQGFLEGEIAKETGRATSPITGRDSAEILAELGGETVPDKLMDLQIRVGAFGDGFGATPDGINVDHLLDVEHGVDFGALQPRLPLMLRTASGRVELMPELIVADFERFTATLDDPAWTDDAMRLIGRRHLRSNNSWMHNVRQLVKGKPRCTLLMHPDDAAVANLSDGDPAVVSSRVGEVTAPVEISDAIRPGVVSLPHGWGHDAPGTQMAVAAEHAGVNSNVLTDHDDRDPLSGNTVLNGIRVTVGAAT